jgi:hypothetical protein
LHCRSLTRGSAMSETAGLLDGYLDIEPFAKEVNRSPRTILRWMDEPNGLPYSRIGNRRLIHVLTARDWVFSRMKNRKPRARKAKA